MLLVMTLTSSKQCMAEMLLEELVVIDCSALLLVLESKGVAHSNPDITGAGGLPSGSHGSWLGGLMRGKGSAGNIVAVCRGIGGRWDPWFGSRL